MAKQATQEPQGLHEILSHIQVNLKANKSQWNKFGKYAYRKSEDILEALKPYLAQYNLTIGIIEELVNVGSSNYIKSTAVLSNGTEEISAIAYAREAVSQSGMQDAQLTGSTSSYAKKYALGNLLALDDTSDADATNDGGGKSTKTESSPAAPVAPTETKEAAKPDPRKSSKQLLDKDHVKYKGARNAVAAGKYSISQIEQTYDLSPDVLKEFEELVRDYLTKKK